VSESVTTGRGPGARRRVTVVTSAYNEQECVDELCSRLVALFNRLGSYDFDVIAVDNGSQDETFARLEAWSVRDARFKVVQLVRNFGTDGGLTAGLNFASGDAVVLIAADLQDPPELIEAFLERWEEGYENVYGIITEREGMGRIRRLNSRLFYFVIGRLTEQPIPPDANDFRLLDKAAYQTLLQLDERNRFLRGLTAWSGYRSVGVPFVRPDRFAGESKASTRAVLKFAIRAVFAHSLTPIMAMPVIGAVLFVIGLGSIGVLTIDWFAFGVPFPGFGSIVALLILLFSILVLFLSVIGLYVGLIYQEVRRRPNFLVRRTVGVE
jgi:polyisoprenyl-phosphate glycosyltransferase